MHPLHKEDFFNIVSNPKLFHFDSTMKRTTATSTRIKDSPMSENEQKIHSSAGSKRVFFLLWIGQFVSLVGTDITKFSLRIWTYQRTQSVSQVRSHSILNLLDNIYVVRLDYF